MVQLLGVYDRILRDAAHRLQYHYVLIDFLCRNLAGSSDAAEIKWCPPENCRL